MISGINHVTFAVSDLDRSLQFYRDLLGCDEVYRWHSGAYLEAGSLWICLSLDPEATGNSDYTHIAFTVSSDDFADIAAKIIKAGVTQWKDNRSEGESLYFCCPDGHRLEIHVGDLRSRLLAISAQHRAHCT